MLLVSPPAEAADFDEEEELESISEQIASPRTHSSLITASVDSETL